MKHTTRVFDNTQNPWQIT